MASRRRINVTITKHPNFDNLVAAEYSQLHSAMPPLSADEIDKRFDKKVRSLITIATIES